MYDGTLYGQWEAIVTFQQMIVLADADGIVDMTPQAIAARTSIPFEIIKKGLGILEAEDPYSRTPGQDGRRIELIDAHRPWGWHIVNHEKYKRMQDADTVRAQTRERVRKHRESKDSNAEKRTVTDSNGQKRHTDTNTDTDTHKPDFLTFWTAYPRKAAKQDAIKAFEKLNLSHGSFGEVLAALESAKASEQWQRDEGKFIPHASTWLNGRRFEDEGHTPPTIKVDV